MSAAMRGGIVLILLAMSLTPALDGVAKELGRDHSPILVCFTRYFMAGLFALALALAFGERIRLRRGDLTRQLFRSALMIGAMTAFITALSLVPMADAVGGFLIAPVVATLIAVLFLGERLTPRRAAGAAVSVAGAALIMRPGLGLEPGTVMALGGGVLLGCYFAASRGGGGEGIMTVLALQSLLGSAMVAPFALADGLPLPDLRFAALAVLLGAVSALCHLLTIEAFRRAEASVLAPFMYFNLFVAVAIGLFWFGEVPADLTLAGLAAILAGGLLTALPAVRLPFRAALGRLRHRRTGLAAA